MTSHVSPDDPATSARPGPGQVVLVDLDVLIAPTDEDEVARAVRASVAAAAPVALLGAVRWEGTSSGEDLVRQWGVEQHGAPLDGRRVRRLTMDVRGHGVADLLEEITWAAIDAVCPTARAEHRSIDAGETAVPTAPDRYPWSSATRVADDGG